VRAISKGDLGILATMLAATRTPATIQSWISFFFFFFSFSPVRQSEKNIKISPYHQRKTGGFFFPFPSFPFFP